MVREFRSNGGMQGLSASCCKSYAILGRSTVVPAAADNAALYNIDLVYEVMLHTKMARQEYSCIKVRVTNCKNLCTFYPLKFK